MKIADLYIRVSTDEQAEKGYSINSQKHILETYCQINKIKIRKIFTEDFSAKTFNRPEWKQVIDFLKKNKHQSDLLLFTRWDRFSRNTSDAYQTIAELKKLGVEAQAIEQPLDLNVPENKLMLAIYLTLPEIENDRKGLSTKAGLRRARKEGRCAGQAPVGYANRTSELGRKYVVVKEPEASIIKWVFEQIELNLFSVSELLQIAYQKGLASSKNNMYHMLRNPFYCGKIVIRKYQDEEEYLSDARHQAIITEEQFNRVQEILNGKQKTKGLSIVTFDNIFLKGFLHCPICGERLLGSCPGGKRIKRFYYHCRSRCSNSLRADFVNNKFIDLISHCYVDKAIERLYIKIIIQAYNNQTGPIPIKTKQLTSRIKVLSKKVNRARELMIDGMLEAAEYEEIKATYHKQISYLENELEELKSLSISWRSLKSITKKALGSLANLSKMFTTAGIGGKRKLISTIINPYIIFDGKEFHQQQFNEVIQLSFNVLQRTPGNNLYQQNKGNETDLLKIELTNKFISDLKAIGELAISVSEFDRYGEMIREMSEHRKTNPRANSKKVKVRKKRLARTISIKRWILESKDLIKQ